MDSRHICSLVLILMWELYVPAASFTSKVSFPGLNPLFHTPPKPFLPTCSFLSQQMSTLFFQFAFQHVCNKNYNLTLICVSICCSSSYWIPFLSHAIVFLLHLTLFPQWLWFRCHKKALESLQFLLLLNRTLKLFHYQLFILIYVSAQQLLPGISFYSQSILGVFFTMFWFPHTILHFLILVIHPRITFDYIICFLYKLSASCS